MKTLYLIRGISGSGKSTLADILWNSIPGARAWSADNFFTAMDGTYHFDPASLPMAHKYCQTWCEAAMTNGCPPIIIHNTFTRRWELRPYHDLATKHGYTVFEIICRNTFSNVHNVPIETVTKQQSRFEY